jgi:hypothetical protein
VYEFADANRDLVKSRRLLLGPQRRADAFELMEDPEWLQALLSVDESASTCPETRTLFSLIYPFDLFCLPRYAHCFYISGSIFYEFCVVTTIAVVD